MQRTFIAIALALAMTCSFAAVTPGTYSKAPVQVVPDNDTNFTNNTGSTFFLANPTVGDIYIISQWSNSTTNDSAYLYKGWFKKLSTKDLSAAAATTLSWNDPKTSVSYYNGYILSYDSTNDTNMPTLRVYQQPFAGGAAIPRIDLSVNANSSWQPAFLKTAYNGKTVYVFYQAALTKINVTNFALGGSAVGTGEWTLTSAYDSGFANVWGEALSTSQTFATWMEGGALKEALIDLSKGTATPAAVGGWNSNMTCVPYATDKKWYGELCYVADNTFKNPTNYSIRTNTTSLASFISVSTNLTTQGVYPYGQYLALFWVDMRTNSASWTYSYDIWNLDTLTNQKPNTVFLTNDGNSMVTYGRIQAGGIYSLTWTPANATANTTITNIMVGMVLGASYLTTIAGFLFAIIAGLFLF